MNILKMLDLKTILLVILGLVVVFVYFYKDVQVEHYKDMFLENTGKMFKMHEELEKCTLKQQEQNKKIEDLKVEIVYSEPKAVDKIKNIYLRDSSCEAELKAYKELFDE